MLRANCLIRDINEISYKHGELNDEVETEKSARMRLKSQVEELEREAEGKVREVDSLEKEVKGLLKREKEQLEEGKKKDKALANAKKEQEKSKAELEAIQRELKAALKEDTAFGLLQTELDKARSCVKGLEEELAKAPLRMSTPDLAASGEKAVTNLRRGRLLRRKSFGRGRCR